tara:strand:+ start:406 stop:1194 length:789 start_codon:yes stop_codon:yes gene_type:complete
VSYLSKDDLINFEKDGYLIKRNLFSESELLDAEKTIEELSSRKIEDWEIGKEMAYYETNLKNKLRVLTRVEKTIEYHESISKIANSKKLHGCLNDLLGEDCVLFKDKINYKRPGGTGWAPHQDVQARWDYFASYFMNALITIDANDIDNGCLYVAPGHHKRKLIGKYDEKLSGNDLNGMNFVPLIAARGDTIFFDGFLPHKSDNNLGTRSRRNIYLTYNRLSEGNKRNEYISKKRQSFPPDNERKPGSEIKDCYAHNYFGEK